jgi:hypothetical protein
MLYFAYGSNMDTVWIRQSIRCPAAEFVCVAKLSGSRLAFTRKSKDGHGVADAVPNPRAVVWGVVWRLNQDDLARLDKREGAKARKPKYVRRPVSVQQLNTGKKLACQTYFVPAGLRKAQEVPTTKEYLGHLLDGARQHGLPKHYVAKLRRLWQSAER